MGLLLGDIGPTTAAAPRDAFADGVVAFQANGTQNTHRDGNTVLGAPCKGSDQDLSLGGGWVVVDMGVQEAIIEDQGNDLKVYESEDSPYCNGVIASNALSGSGSTADHINCAATNGASASQTISICNAMKARGVVVYTVGFHIDNDATALSVFHQCATDDSHFYLADDGTSLQNAFRNIGQSISQLRITH